MKEKNIYNLALYIEGDRTIKEAGEMIDALFGDDDLCISLLYEGDTGFSDGCYNLVIQYYEDDEKKVRDLAKRLGFIED